MFLLAVIAVILCSIYLFKQYNANEKQYKSIIFNLLLIAISVPFIINQLYLWGNEKTLFYTDWDGSDALSFYGSFLAFCGTVILGAVAVYQNNKANQINDNILEISKQSERNVVLPYFSFNRYLARYEGDLFASSVAKLQKSSSETTEVEDTLKRIDIQIDEINFIISKDEINICTELDNKRKEKIQSEYNIKPSVDCVTVGLSNHNYQKFMVQNCGRGSAINLKCRLWKKGFENCPKNDVYSVPFTVPHSNKFDLGLYFDLSTTFSGNYTLELLYKDIYSNHYLQRVPIQIIEESNSIEMDTYQPQEIMQGQ